MPTFSGRIDKQKSQFRITDRSIFDEWVRTEAGKEKDYIYTLKIEKQSKAHSREQENFRWGVLYPEILFTMRDAGWDNVRNKEDVHHIVCELFLKEDIVNEKTGETLPITRRSSGLTKEEEQVFQDNIRWWASEYFNTILSQPNEQKELL